MKDTINVHIKDVLNSIKKKTKTLSMFGMFMRVQVLQRLNTAEETYCNFIKIPHPAF